MYHIAVLDRILTRTDKTCIFSPAINQNNYTKQIDYMEDLECGICIDSYESQEYCEVSCSHRFHSKCIFQWIKTKNDNQSTITCPNCRDELKKIEKLLEYNEEEKVIFDKICEYFANFKCVCEKNYQSLLDIEISSLDSDDELFDNIECNCGFDYIERLFEDGYCYINIQGFPNLKITWNLIEWFVKTYLKSTDGLIYLNYLSKEKNIPINYLVLVVYQLIQNIQLL